MQTIEPLEIRGLVPSKTRFFFFFARIVTLTPYVDRINFQTASARAGAAGSCEYPAFLPGMGTLLLTIFTKFKAVGRIRQRPQPVGMIADRG